MLLNAVDVILGLIYVEYGKMATVSTAEKPGFIDMYILAFNTEISECRSLM